MLSATHCRATWSSTSLSPINSSSRDAFFLCSRPATAGRGPHEVLLLPACGERRRGHAPSPGLRSLSSGRALRAGPVGNLTSRRARGEEEIASESCQATLRFRHHRTFIRWSMLKGSTRSAGGSAASVTYMDCLWHRRNEVTPFCERLCPAMTKGKNGKNERERIGSSGLQIRARAPYSPRNLTGIRATSE